MSVCQRCNQELNERLSWADGIAYRLTLAALDSIEDDQTSDEFASCPGCVENVMSRLSELAAVGWVEVFGKYNEPEAVNEAREALLGRLATNLDSREMRKRDDGEP